MNDEAVILEDLLLRLSTLNPNPVLPNSNRTFCFPMRDKDRKALGDCIYKYLGEHYPESPFAIMRNAVKEAKGKPKPTNLNDIITSAKKVSEALSKFQPVPEKATDIEALKIEFQLWLKRLQEFTEQELKKTPLAKLGD